MSDLTINISRLSEGAHRYDFETEPANLALDARFSGKVSVHAALEMTGHQLFLRADVQAVGEFTCDRCLDDFKQTIVAHYEIVYVAEDGAVAGRDEEEIQYIGPDKTILDLGDDVREFLILAVPLKLLCREDCRGLCPACGSNRNKTECSCDKSTADPRWDALRKISSN